MIRHLLLLSREQLALSGHVVWIVHPESKIWKLSEVTSFWKTNGHGQQSLELGRCCLVSDSSSVMNTVSTTSMSTQAPWNRLCSALSPEHALPIFWANSSLAMTVDTTPLNTLTTQELDKLMNSVRKLHRRFGHPSNQLLIKNLKARNADPVVIAAASQLQCDECQEGKIRLPSPAVNLDRTDKLWDCLQVDGFDMRIGSQVHHFVLMVDEASGYAVIREAFRHPEEEGRNLTGEEFVSILREAWFGYFGYPATLKLDLEGAHRSSKLAQECLDNGIEIVAAPAEHHQTIAEVERMIGHIRHKVETFVREQPVDPKVAALTMVMTHNSLARTHGFSPLQWALGRDWSPGDRLLETDMDALSSSTTSPFGATVQLRAEAAKAFVEHRARDIASRAKNSKTRSTTTFLPGDLVFYRRFQHPADLPANNLVDRPRLRLSRWYGPARILATETKNEGVGRRPSAIVWGIAGGRLKRFHASQLRHSSEAERLIAESTTAVSMPWTMTSLTRLLNKGSFDNETKAKRRSWPKTPKGKRELRRAAEGARPRLPPEPPLLPAPVPPEDGEDSDPEMIPDRMMRKRDAATLGPSEDWTVDQLLNAHLVNTSEFP